MDDVPQLGNLLGSDERRRDAIHIAIAPVTASVILHAGDHVGFARETTPEYVCSCEKPIGIVDPFLPRNKAILPGERFWLFLYPQTITSLRHVWVHPAFMECSNKARQLLEREGVGKVWKGRN